MGTINVILAALSQTKSHTSEIISITARQDTEEQVPKSKRVRIEVRPTLGISDKENIGTYQPHDNALVVTLLIGGYDVKRVLVHQGSEAEIMYPDLYKRLNLNLKDLLRYESPLIGFDRKMVIPKGMIKLPVQTRAKIVEMDFIVVDAFSPYTAILARLWLHTMGAMSSTLHMKVKNLTEGGGEVEELVGSQAMARQYLVASIRHQSEDGVLVSREEVP